MTIKQTLNWAKNQLRYASERPIYEAEILMMFHLGVDRVYLSLHDNETLKNEDRYRVLVARRMRHEPIEYITNTVSFYDIDLFITQGALIPRPETELLIDKASETIREHKLNKIAEIGVGSGAISILLARRFPHLQIIATDISKDALSIASRNIDSFGLKERIELIHTSLLDSIDEQLDMIVSNPPYIANHTPLAANVAHYEPHTALYGGTHGDELLKSIITLTEERNIPHLACEMGYDQKETIEKFVDSINAFQIELYADYAGLDRGFVLHQITKPQ